jgi:hypothetical protein
MLKIPFLALAGLACWAALPAAACLVCQQMLQPQYVVLTVHGKLDAKHLTPEPGPAVGRNDGSITAGGKTYRLDFGNDRALRERAGKLDGQRVVLTGRLEKRLVPVFRLPRPELLPLPQPPRPPRDFPMPICPPILEVEVIVVTDLRADKTDCLLQWVRVEIKGKLRRTEIRTSDPTKPAYILWTVEAGGKTYQLDFTSRFQSRRAAELEGQTVLVTGTLGSTSGLAGQHVTVSDLRAALAM